MEELSTTESKWLVLFPHSFLYQRMETKQTRLSFAEI